MTTTLLSLGADLLAPMFCVFDVVALTAAVRSCRALRDRLQQVLRPMVAEGRLARRAQREMFRHFVALEPRIETTRVDARGSRMSAVGPGEISLITATTAPVRGRMEYVFAARARADGIAGRISCLLTVFPRTPTAGILVVVADGGAGDDDVRVGYCRGVVAALVALGYG